MYTLRNIFGALLLTVFSVCNTNAQDWNADLIPDSLKNGGQNAVVRLYEIKYSELSPTEGTCNYHTVITVLNKKGDRYGNWIEGTEDNHTQISRFQGNLYDASGNQIRKIKKNEISISRYSEYVATSSQTNYIEEPSGVGYPYTVEYEWVMKYTNGILSYPACDPLTGEMLSMQGATYTLKVHPGTQIGHREIMTTAKCEKTVEGDYDVYCWTLPARKAIISDEYETQALYRYPMILAHPINFSYDRYEGELKSWNSLGKWSYDLTCGRDVLPQVEKDKVHSLTDHLSTNKEKIAALYKYLGEKTRYVAIMLGIGGWMPMTAEEVSKTGFGDCKALSNFMHSMLKEVGITSYLTDISTNYENLLPDFPNFMQLNHMILCVPDKDTLWIDCTAADFLPFGCIPTSLRGHECIILKEEGGELARIPAITATENKYVVKSELTFDESMTVKTGHYSTDLYGRHFESKLSLVKKDDKSKTNQMNSYLNFGNSKVTGVKIDSVMCPSPHIHAECDFTITYGRKSGSRMFLPANPYTHYTAPKFRNGRTTPIVSDIPHEEIDSIILHLPANVKVEGLAKEADIEMEFGSIKCTSTLKEDNTLEMVYHIIINKGEYPIEKKEQFLEFFETLSKRLADQVVVKMESGN